MVMETKKVFDYQNDQNYQKYYQNEPRFNGIYSRGNLLKKIKHGYM